jgi:hypothetical protein
VHRRSESFISTPVDDTAMAADGAVRSVQGADLDMPHDAVEEIWSAVMLERLARTYWWFLSRVTLGIIRVRYSADGRAVCVFGPPLVLLRFHPPEYKLSENRGVVRWNIRSGLLVAKKDAGYLEIDVERRPSDREGYERAHVEVEVASFYPALARPFRWFYVNTQSRIHVLVTYGFLRRLARLDLEESAVGRFAEDGTDTGQVDERREGTVASTPWRVIAVMAAAFALVGALLAWAFRKD